MGIPHLTTFLRPYAELEPIAGRDVVVDGPGLCYHIYYKCLGWRGDARNAFEAAPSYDELQRASIEWLDVLRSSGAVVKAIYFDGFLPPAKFNTRLERLGAQTRQLLDYCNSHAIPCRASSNRKTTSVSIFTNQSPHPALTSLPASAFIVPAILEALGKSVYKSITEVVPGEADLYCAGYMKEHGGLIFTGDSDLLVHDLGSNGAVTFFRDVEGSFDIKPVALQSRIYHPALIAERLRLPNPHGLLSLAFEMFMDKHGTFSNLVSHASNLKAITAHGKMYEDFCREYKHLPPTVGRGKVQSEDPILSNIGSLDPRTSELILQFPSLAKAAGQNPEAGSPSRDALHVFLPFLRDWPLRTSAWEMSTSVRQLAYGLINLIVPEAERRFSVNEHRRQQGKFSGREWQLPSIAEIPEACMTVVRVLDQLQGKLPKASKEDLWLATEICQDIEWSSSVDKTPLSCLVTKQLSDLQDPNKYHTSCSWDVVHFLAQLQGSYYSFRVLKQVTELLFVYSNHQLLPQGVRALHGHLEDLPGFCEVPDLDDLSSLYARIEGSRMLRVAYELLGIDEPQPAKSLGATKTASKKRKRQRGAAAVDHSAGKKKSANPFDLLKLE